MYFLSQTNTWHTDKVVRGFGLVELMVSISIMMLLSSIILVRHTAFNGAVLLRNQAYEVAFALRQAQLMAVSGNNNSGGASLGTTTQQFGVYFNKSTGNNQSYIIFHDVNVNGVWDGTTTDDQIGAAGSIDKRFKIQNFTKADGSTLMATTINKFSIVFTRPNFDAKFKGPNGGDYTGPAFIDIAQVNAIDQSTGAVRRVEVESTGAISVTGYDTP